VPAKRPINSTETKKRKAPSTPATMSKQQATLSKQRSLSNQHSTLLPQTTTMSNDSIVKFRPFENVKCCFDIVVVFGNNVAGFGNSVERNFVFSTMSKQIEHVQFICFDIVERTEFRSTLLPKQHSTLSKESFNL